MANDELKELTKRVKVLFKKGMKSDEIRIKLEKEGKSPEIISGALVESQIKKANTLLKHRRKTHNIIGHSSHLSLIILIILMVITLIEQGNVSENIILATMIMIKLFSISMILKSFMEMEIGWTLSLIGTSIFPGTDIIGASWYYLVEFLKKKNSEKNHH